MRNDLSHKNPSLESVVKGVGEKLEPNGGSSMVDRPPDSVTMVIIGASGDLSFRKLLPSLFNLYINNVLPSRFSIIGWSALPPGCR